MTLTSPKFFKNGLKNVSLPALFGKTSYAESYIFYFFKQAYTVLKRANTAKRLLLSTFKDFVIFLQNNPEYILPTLNSFHEQLKQVNEAEVVSTILCYYYELFKTSSLEIQSTVFVPHLLMSFQDLPKTISSELIFSTIKLVPDELFNSLEPLFSFIHTSNDKNDII